MSFCNLIIGKKIPPYYIACWRHGWHQPWLFRGRCCRRSQQFVSSTRSGSVYLTLYRRFCCQLGKICSQGFLDCINSWSHSTLTQGPGAWVVIAEIYPLKLRGKAMSLATASNWSWNWVIAFVVPYITDPSVCQTASLLEFEKMLSGIIAKSQEGNLGSKIAFIWMATSGIAAAWTFFFVSEVSTAQSFMLLVQGLRRIISPADERPHTGRTRWGMFSHAP